ncbi:peptidoglycan-recognition protein SC2-like [Rhinophrynus dorsalis]
MVQNNQGILFPAGVSKFSAQELPIIQDLGIFLEFSGEFLIMMRLVLLLSAFCAVTYACPKIISQAGWGAAKSSCNKKLSPPLSYVFIHHTTGPSCNTEAACKAQVKGIQNYHMKNRDYCNIGYSFLVGGDGQIYEGRGWKTVGAHTLNYNTRGYGISFIGTFSKGNPTAAAQKAAKDLIACGVKNKFIKPNYVLKGHRDVFNTDCPGNTLYNTIKTWPKFRPGKN